MITVAATEFSKNFGRYREAVRREPVAITSQASVAGYFISGSDYENYLHLQSMVPRAFAVEELSEETIHAIAASRMDTRHDHLNSLLDE